MHDGVRPGAFDGVKQVAGFLRLAENESGARIHRRTMAFGEIVIDGNRVPGVQQFFRANGTDITGAAGDEDIHVETMKRARWSAKRKMTEVSVPHRAK